MTRKKSKGRFLIIIGTMLIISALSLTLYNLGVQRSAEDKKNVLLSGIKSSIVADISDGSQQAVPDEEYTDYVPEKPSDMITDLENADIPVKKLREVNVNGVDMIGIVQIPCLGVELPVTSDWNYKLMKKAACRYQGELLENNLIICAHNYSDFFGHLDALNSGDVIYFVDMDGVRYTYEVVQTELVDGYDVDEMINGGGEWDMTLFSCTWNGKSRVTVRALMVISDQ